MKKIYTLIFTFILAFYSSIAFAVDGDPVIEGLLADRVLTSSLESVSSIDATTEATLESELDHDDITGAGTLDTETEIEAGIDHDDISGAGTVDTDEEVQDSIGGILDDGTVGEVVFTYDDITPNIYGTVQESELDHDSLSGAGTVDTAAEIQGVSVGGDLSGTIGNATESDPLYSAWDKDYADLINTPDLFGLLGLADPDADKYPIWDDSETAWAWADGGSMPYPGAGIAVSTGSAWDTSITDNSANWNAAYSWGDHSTEGYWSSSNDGPGSGLDADLWDGYQFSDYLNQALKTTSSPTFSTVYATYLSNGTYGAAIQMSDSWLRLNPSSGFSSGIYCGSGILRTDGTLQIGSSGANLYADSTNLTYYGATDISLKGYYDADTYAQLYSDNSSTPYMNIKAVDNSSSSGCQADMQSGPRASLLSVDSGGSTHIIAQESRNAVIAYPANAIYLGDSGYYWYCVTSRYWSTISDFYYFDDRDDLAVLHAIKGSGKYDEVNGWELIDDSTIDPSLFSRNQEDIYMEPDEGGSLLGKAGEIAYSSTGEPITDMKMWVSLLVGAVKQLDTKYEAQVAEYDTDIDNLKTENQELRALLQQLEGRVTALENKSITEELP